MGDWYRSDTHTVTERFMQKGLGGIAAEVSEHRGHQNWEADVRVLGPIQHGEAEVIEERHFHNKEAALDWLTEEHGFDVPREEWNLDPQWSNVSERIGPGGRVG